MLYMFIINSTRLKNKFPVNICFSGPLKCVVSQKSAQIQAKTHLPKIDVKSCFKITLCVNFVAPNELTWSETSFLQHFVTFGIFFLRPSSSTFLKFRKNPCFFGVFAQFWVSVWIYVFFQGYSSGPKMLTECTGIILLVCWNFYAKTIFWLLGSPNKEKVNLREESHKFMMKKWFSTIFRDSLRGA